MAPSGEKERSGDEGVSSCKTRRSVKTGNSENGWRMMKRLDVGLNFSAKKQDGKQCLALTSV